MHWTRSLGPVAFSLIAACEQGNGIDPGTFDLRQLALWQLLEEQRIGSAADPDAWFTSVGLTVAEDARGNVYGLDFREQQIRTFDSKGQFRRSIGRRGEGPGEFDGASSIGIFRDTLYVIEPRRVTLFSLEGELLAVVPGQGIRGELGVPPVLMSIQPAHLQTGGRLRSRPNISPMTVTADSVRVPLLLFNLQGAVTDTLYWYVVYPVRWPRIPLPDGSTGIITNVPDVGKPITVVHADGRVVVERIPARSQAISHFRLLVSDARNQPLAERYRGRVWTAPVSTSTARNTGQPLNST